MAKRPRSLQPQRMRLWEKMEDRVLFDAVPDGAAMMEGEMVEDPFAPDVDGNAAQQDMPASSDGVQQVPQQGRRELVIVDTAVENYEQLVADILGEEDPTRDIDVVTFDSSEDGVTAITRILRDHSGLDAVHLVSHGTDAAIQLGSVWLSNDNMASYAGDVASWADAFNAEGDLLIYGCHLGESADGRAFVESLATLTETDVAASTDDTGYAPRGGDWDFEYAVGTLETSIAFSQEVQTAWTGLLAVGPQATLDVPASVFVGQNFSFDVTFNNTGNPGEVGYGPFIDLIFPVNGVDGAAGTDTPDGLDFASATYLGAAVNAIELIFPDDDGAGAGTTGTIDHPFAVDQFGNPLQVTGTAGDKLVVLELPFGSFTPEQPAAVITVNTTMSNLADLGSPLTIASRAGFRYGADALDNPTAPDPTILSDSQTDSSAWVETASVTPTLLTMTKTEISPESETATGPNYVRQYRIDIDIADGQTVTDFDITDALPNNIVFQSLDSLTSSDGSTVFTNNAATLSTTDPVNGQQLLVNASTVTGSAGVDISVLYSFYVPEVDADGNRVIPANGEDDLAASVSTNTASALGDYSPIDTRDVGGTDNASGGPAQATIDNKSIAIRKSVTIINDTGTAGATPGDTLQYTLTFQISDYYTFGNLIVDDIFQDGQLFDFGYGATLNVTDFNGNTVGNFTVRDSLAANTGQTLVVDQTQINYADNGTEDGSTPDGTDGSTTLRFDLSQALRDLGEADGILQGGLSNGAANLGAATGTIVFQTVIQDEFADTFPSGDRSVDQGDSITNSSLSITGDVQENQEDGSITTVIGSESDTSSAGVQIVGGSLSKEIYAINGNTTLPIGDNGLVIVSPHDVVTYRIQYTLPTSDFEDLKFTDFVPLPVFDVDDHNADNVGGDTWTFDVGNSFDATAPLSGVVEFGPNDTFYNSRPGFSDTSSAGFFAPPQITVDTVANSLEFLYGSYDDPSHAGTTVELLFSVTVQDDPFADGLFLTNIVRAEEGRTNQGSETLDEIVQIELTEPELNITKGIVGSDNGSAVFDSATGPAGVTFSGAGSAGSPFTGTVNSDGLAAQAINANITDGVDAGDTVRFAIVVENTGNSRRGAFDVRVQDNLPSEFTFVAGSLQVVDGTGASIGFSDLGGGLFGSGIELDDPGATAAQPDGTDAGAIDQYDPTDGRNIAIIFYDAVLDTSVESTETVTNNATLFNYSGLEGAPDFTTTDLTDDATATTSTAQLAKTLDGSEIDNANNAANEAVIGELLTYEIVIDVPEGSMSNVQVLDQLDSGLAFVSATISASSGLATDVAGGFNAVASSPTVTNIGGGAQNLGRSITFDFGDLTNTNTDNSTTEQITITYDVVVVNSTDNDAGATRNNSATLSWDSGPSQSDTAANITILEPNVTVSKTVDTPVADDGDTVTFTIVVTNTGGTFGADAFDVDLTDVLPSGFTYDAGSLVHTAGVAPATLSESSGTISADWTTIGFGQSSTIEFEATLNSSFSTAGETNEADVEWTSLAGDVTTSRSSFNTLGVERTGDPTDPAQSPGDNDYTANDTATVDFPLVPTKSIVATSEAHTSDGTADTAVDPRLVAIGEVVTYELRMEVGEGTIDNVVFRDLMTNGMTLLPGTATFEIIADANMTVAGDLSGANSGAITIPGTRISVTPGGTQTIDFDLGTIVNNDDDPNAEELIIRFDAIASNTNDNNDGDAKTNSFEFRIDGTTEATSNTVHAEIVEPEISNVDKHVLSTSADGLEVTYQVSFSNSGSASAMDVVIDDALATELDLQTGSISVNTTGTVNGADTTNSTVNDLDIRIDEVGVGATVTITYTVDVAFAGTPIQNNADVTYTSTPGTNGTAGATPGTPGAANGERTGDGTGENDYQDDDGAFLGSIGDRIWYDIDGDGTQDAGEGGIPGATITLVWFGPDGAFGGGDDVTRTTTTDANGDYEFTALPAGNFSVTVDPNTLPNGVNSPTFDLDGIGTAHTVNTSLADTAAGIIRDDVDFGYEGTGSIGDTVFFDYDESGAQDNGEPGIGGVTVTLTWEGFTPGFGDGDEVTYTLVTDANGNYDFPDLPSGDFIVDVNAATIDFNEDSVADTVVLTTANDPLNVTLAIGQDFNDADFGYHGTGSIGDHIFFDLDGDGTEDANEVGYPGLTVTLDMDFDDDGVTDYTVTTMTDANGDYTFDNLPPGDYDVTVTPPANTTNTLDPNGGANSTSTLTLGDGENNVAQDFAYQGTGTISDLVWLDLDGDGTQDAGEPGIVGQNIQLEIDLDGDGNVDQTLTTTTDTNGNYSFGNLPAGDYTVTVLNPLSGVNPSSDFDGLGSPHTSDVTLNVANPSSNAQDFGYQGTGSIGDTVYWDIDGDGTQDAGEVGLYNVPVSLEIDFNQDGTFDATLNTFTDVDGNYSFGNLPAVDYNVVVTPLAGTVQTDDPDTTFDNESSITLGVSENNVVQDFGYRGDSVVGDTIFWDVNNDGTQDAGDLGLPGIDVTIEIDFDGDGNSDYTETTTTDANGNYSFTNLIPGGYTITVDSADIPGGMSANPTVAPNGTLTPHTTNLALGVSETNNDQDFGYTGTASLGDRVWLDADGDGVQDPTNEPGLSNVDVTITWFGGDGTFGTADDETFTTTTDGSGSYDFVNLPAGDYRVDVDQSDAPIGTSLTTANDTHNVNLTAGEDHDLSDFGFQGPGSIGDFVFYDVDGNGIYDPLVDDSYPGVTVTLTADLDGDGVDESFIAVTDANGAYSFDGLPYADYTVTVTGPSGTSPTVDATGLADNVSTVTLNAANPTSDTQDFGLTGTGAVGDTIFFDVNGDGTQTGTEPGIPDVTVQIDVDLDGDGTPDFTATTTTDANGNYSFDNIPAGSHTVTVTTPTGSSPTSDLNGDSNPDNAHTFVLGAGETNNNEDFGFLGTGSIGDTIYWDVDGDGTQDPGEVGLYNIPVQLDIDFDQDGNVDHSLTTTTDINGNYVFNGLMVGDYDVIVTPLAGTVQTDDPDATFNDTSSLTLGDGENNVDQDFGYRGDSALGDTVFWDVNNDGTHDGGDVGLEGVDVTIEIDFDGDGSSDYTQTIQSDANGNYNFDNLIPGDYTVTVDSGTVPGGLASTPTADGDVIDTPHTSDVTLGVSETNNDQDFGYTGTGSVGETIYWDPNANGDQDAGEPGLPGVLVTLEVDIDGDGTTDYTFTDTTDSNGNYGFANLPPVNYTVTVTQPSGTTQHEDPDGTADNTTTLTLGDGEDNVDQNFGYAGNGSIGDIVFFDYVGDGGVFNPAENDRGMAGVDVTLAIDVNGDATPDYTTTVSTDANGNYLFENLIGGTYAITTDPTDLPDLMGSNPTYDADQGANGLGHTSTLVLADNENNTDQDFGYHATPDYNITKDDGLDSVVVGQSVSYTITLRNDGTFRGNNVVVTDTFPTNILENVTASSGGIVDVVAGTITWNATTTPALAVLDVGEQVQFTVTGDVVSILDGNNDALVNSVNVTDDAVNGIDSTLANNSDTDTDSIVDITTLKNVTGVAPNGDNWDVTFELFVENTGSVQLEDLTLFDNLASQFGTAFVSVTTPVLNPAGISSGGTAPTINGNWETNTSLDMFDPTVTNEVLMPGESYTVTFTATLDPDFSGTSFTLDNQAVGGGTDNTTDPGSPTTVDDDSDSGAGVDSTNPGEPGDNNTEDDPTPIYLPDISIAKQQGTTSQDPVTRNWSVEYTFVVENIGTVTLDSLTLVDDIAGEFGNAFVQIEAGSLAVSNFTGNGTLTENAGWEGDTSLQMINAAGASLDPGEGFEISFTVEIDPDGVDGLSQPLQNQATTSGRGLDENGVALQDPGGNDIITSDDSDSGTSPNNTNANEPGDTGGSNDATPLVIPEIGVAKRLVSSTSSASAGNRDLTYELVVRNLGTVNLTDLTLTEDMEAHFGDAFVGVSSAPQFTASTATDAPDFILWDGNEDGIGNAEMFDGASGLLEPGQEFTIRFTVEVDIDQLMSGSNNQVQVGGAYDARPLVPGDDGTVTDLSDTGSDPAGNNPGQPGDTGGFDDPTLVPAIGIAKNHGDFTAVDHNLFEVPVTLVIENLGATDLANLQVIEDIASNFGAAFVSVSDLQIDASGVTNTAPDINANWLDDTSLNMLDGTGLLSPGDTFTLTFNVVVDPDAGGTSQLLDNQSTATGSDPGNPLAVVQDLSDSGSDSSSGNAGEPGDTGTSDDATPLQIPDVALAKQIVDAKQLGLTFELTVEIVMENTGTVDLNDLQMFDDLADQYGANFGSVATAPTIVSSTATTDPNLNGGYTNDTTQNMFDGTSGLLKPGESITVRLVVEVVAVPGQSEAIVVNQAQGGGAALDENGTPLTDESGVPLDTITDDSDSGANPNTINAGAPGDTGGYDDPTEQKLIFFTYDSFNDLSSGSKELWRDGSDREYGFNDRILSKEISSLAPEPIFSGSARPGTQIIGRVLNSYGVVVGEEMSFADVGGNWMMQFHDIAGLDHARIEFVEVVGTGSPFAPNGDSYGYLGLDAHTNDYAALEPWTNYEEAYEFSAVLRGSTSNSLARTHQTNSRPIGFGV